MLEKRREPARLQHVQEGMEKAGPKAKYERMGKAGLDHIAEAGGCGG